MAKFLKRIGTTAEKFALELILDKVEMKIVKDARVSISFKRGNRKVDSKNAPTLIKGVADFDESLILPITFYLDKKKEKYQEKQGELIAYINTEKGPKKVGLTKFDLAEYLNNGTREKKEVIPILKCKDQSAKFHLTVKLTPLAELEHQLENDGESDDSADEGSKTQKTDGDNASDEDSKSVFSIRSKDLNKSGLTDNSNKSQLSGKSQKSQDRNLRPKEERKDRSKSPGPDETKNLFNFKKNSDISETKETRPTANFFTKIDTGISRSKNLDSSDDESMSQSDKRAQANQYKDLERQLNVARMERNNFQKLCNELQTELQETKDELSEAQRQVESLTKLYDKARAMAGNKKDSSNSGSFTLDTNVQEYKDKISQLEQEIRTLKKTTSPRGTYKASESETRRYQELESKYKELEQELEEYKEKVETLENDLSKKKSVDKASYEQFKKINKEVAALKEENQDLKDNKEELEETIKELENKLKEQKSKTSRRGKSPDASTESSDYMDKFFDLEKKYNQMEETLNKKVALLEKENKYLKERTERVETSTSNKTSKQLEEDNEQLLAENESLKKQLKEASYKGSTSTKGDNRQIEDLKNQIETLESELTKTKTSLKSLKNENEKLATEMHEIENENIQFRVQVSKLSDDLLLAKTNLGTVMNAIFEYAGPEVFDMIEEKVSFGEKD